MRSISPIALVAFLFFGAVLGAATPSPSCSQTRSPTDPTASAINNAIISDDTINRACDASHFKLDPGPQVDYYALNNAYFFNHTVDTVGGSEDQSCQDVFNTIFNTCVTKQGFWGGSLVSSGVTYSIGAQKYPTNPLPGQGPSAPTSGSGTSNVPTPAPGGTTSLNLPQGTTSSQNNAPLITITTSYDPQPVTYSSFDPSITGNTVTHTSDDKHSAGLFPVIKGGPGCVFCPPGLDHGGLVLWGMAKPGVYPPPTPPPFPGVKNWPTITIGNDLQPTESGEDEKPTSTAPSSKATSSCTTSAIVSDCSVICSPTGSATSAPASCSTSCSSTTTGCGVSGTTITSTASGSACQQPGPFTSVTSGSATSYSWETELYLTLFGASSAPATSGTTSPTTAANPSPSSPSPAGNTLVALPVSTDPPGPLTADTNCEGAKSSTSSDIFSCFTNATLFQLFAPLGTDVSLNKGTNDKNGWGTWKGAGCYCNQGALCCDPGAKAPVDANGGLYNDINTSGSGTDIVALFKYLQTTAGGGCTCDGKKSDIEKRADELHEIERSLDNHLSGIQSKKTRRGVVSQVKGVTNALVSRINRSNAWNTYASKGQGYWDAFNNRDPNAPDKVLCTFDGIYEMEQASTRPPVASFQPFLAKIGLKIASVYQTVVTYKAPPGKEDAELSNLFDPASGTIVASGNEIGDAPDHWSDIAWYLWKRSCLTANPPVNTNNLKVIIQRFITNQETVDIIRDALPSDYNIGDKAYFKPDNRDLNANAFWPLLGSPNGNGIIHMLDDNKHALQGKSVVQIGVWANPDRPTPNGGYETHVWAELTS